MFEFSHKNSYTQQQEEFLVITIFLTRLATTSIFGNTPNIGQKYSAGVAPKLVSM